MKRYLEEIPSSEYILLGIDHTAWGRRGAKTLKDRTYEHQASSNNSVTVGQGYSTIAWLPEEQGNWALSLRHERITSYETPISKIERLNPQSSGKKREREYEIYIRYVWRGTICSLRVRRGYKFRNLSQFISF